VILRYLATLALINVPTFAFSQTAQCDPSGSQAEMNVCANEDFAKADLVLNDVYILAIEQAERIDAAGELREAQCLWIQYRDAACTAEVSHVQEGTLRPLLFATCRTRLSDRRTADLNYFVGLLTP
jgi:uncharacterized protein YecT (DUF1311 family)